MQTIEQTEVLSWNTIWSNWGIKILIMLVIVSNDQIIAKNDSEISKCMRIGVRIQKIIQIGFGR